MSGGVIDYSSGMAALKSYSKSLALEANRFNSVVNELGKIKPEEIMAVEQGDEKWPVQLGIFLGIIGPYRLRQFSVDIDNCALVNRGKKGMYTLINSQFVLDTFKSSNRELYEKIRNVVFPNVYSILTVARGEDAVNTLLQKYELKIEDYHNLFIGDSTSALSLRDSSARRLPL